MPPSAVVWRDSNAPPHPHHRRRLHCRVPAHLGFRRLRLRATARLSRYRQSLAANVESLRERNAALTADLRRLREDPEANELLARELGLYRSGDRVLRIEGLPARRHLYTVGSLLRQKRSTGSTNPWLTLAGIGVSILVGVASVVLRRRETRGRPRHAGGARTEWIYDERTEWAHEQRRDYTSGRRRDAPRRR